jgi:hypothetical protein
MKKYIIIVISFVFVSNISAQSFGLKGGAAITTFSGSDVKNVDSRTGFYFGSFMKLGDGNIRYSPEVIFHQKGAIEDTNEIKINYIDISVNGNFHINDELALVLGPYFAYAISGTDNVGSIKDWNIYNKTEFGANIGATYELNDLLCVDLRYGLAFSDVKQAQTKKNRSIQIGIGYIFGY